MGGDEVVEAATRLFSALGYDGVTTAMIAEAAGATEGDVAALGGKRGVYEAVMRRVLEAQVALVEEMHRTLPPDVSGLHGMVDMFLDFYQVHPEAITLWQHRGLSDAADLAGIERDYAAPVVQGINDLIARSGVHPRARFTLHNALGWSFYGFLTIGIVHPDGSTTHWEDPAARDHFRQAVRSLINALAATPP
ncbi:TetR/AcrR family transcriptional regulator [Actinocorallia populi]|uniref:TetR/AcrR family transcriptional regulator n=1 Tax=Actinocorallia populi TaxID=2079200 RepID=UPI000D08AE6A|nr:TetR/AcrR family transcriptional regulator [Actinocorallia populi]